LPQRRLEGIHHRCNRAAQASQEFLDYPAQSAGSSRLKPRATRVGHSAIDRMESTPYSGFPRKTICSHLIWRVYCSSLDDLHRQLILHGGREFRHKHGKTAVSDKRHTASRVRDLRCERVGEAVHAREVSGNTMHLAPLHRNMASPPSSDGSLSPDMIASSRNRLPSFVRDHLRLHRKFTG